MLRLDQISHQYGDTRALEAVNLRLETGIVGLIGVNGAGKTTLLSIASGALKPTSGAVSIDSMDLYQRNDRRKALPKVAIMPQRLPYPPRFTVHEFVTYIGYLRGLSWRKSEVVSKEVLERVGLDARIYDRMSALSGGMLRRVGLAQALVTSPEVILLDEPTTGLDPQQRASIRELLAGLAPESLIVMSSHIVEDIETLAERVVLLHEGALFFDGTIDQLVSKHSPKDGIRTTESALLNLIGKGR